ncbi:ribonuclease H-like domain-containing protein [Tanacetum coccineum]
MSDDPAKKVDSSSSSDLNLTFGDPLYLHPNDTGGSPILTFKLAGTDNYKDMCNSVVFTWILNSLSSDLYVGAIYAKTSFELWTDLKDTYDKVDGLAVFNLHKSINSLSESGASLADYYNNLNSLWKQFDAMISLHSCTCDAAKHFEKHNQLIKLIQFLMGLDENYLAIRSNILTREPLSLVKAAFAIVSGEESHRYITSTSSTKPTATAFVAKTFDKKRFNNNNNNNKGSSSNSNNRGPNPNLKCTNCNKIGHTVDRCFEIVSYPAGYVKRNFNSNSRPLTSNNSTVDPDSNNASSSTTSNSPVSLSKEQLTRLMNLLNDNGVSSANANMSDFVIGNISLGWIVDSGANQYMTVSAKFLVNVVDISNLGLTVGHPNAVHCSPRMLSQSESTGSPAWTRPNDEGRVSSNDDGTKLSPDVNQGNDDSRATSIDKTNNTHPEGTVNVKYGVERVVNYANLSLANYCFISALNKSIEPTCYEEVVLDSNWIDAMNAKIEALNENQTWIIVDLPANRKAIGNKWNYKIKYKFSGDIDKYKLDVNNAFLYGDLDEDIYMTILKGFVTKDKYRTRKYCLELLKDYGLLGCKHVSTPMVPNSVLPYEPTEDDPLLDNITGYQKLLGKLIYHTHTRPDIAYSVLCAPGKGIRYKYPDIKDTICDYSDADWAKCLKTRKSITGCFRCAVKMVETEDIDPKNSKLRKDKGHPPNSEKLKLTDYDPLFLHSNDSNGISIISFKMEGTKNYKFMRLIEYWEQELAGQWEFLVRQHYFHNVFSLVLYSNIAIEWSFILEVVSHIRDGAAVLMKTKCCYNSSYESMSKAWGD